MAPDKNFNFPFEPYPIQQDFMHVLYNAIEDRKVAILESPTGTGKSLSLIAGSLTWLREHKRKEFEDSLNDDTLKNEPDWVVENARKAKRREALDARMTREKRLQRARAKEAQALKSYESGHFSAKRRRIDTGQNTRPPKDSLESFLLDDYNSEDESNASTIRNLGVSAETQRLLNKLGLNTAKVSNHDEDLEEGPIIYYCSRTHSQITQFASELRKVKLPPIIDPDPSTSLEHESAEHVIEGLRHLTLASRKNLCINPKVSRLNSTTAINEKCLDIQKPGTSQDHKCPFVPTKDDEPLLSKFKDHTISKIRDIEDLGDLGKTMSVCPYYASRSVVKSAEIITLPYPLLLQKSARDTMGISLKDNIIIIDEAHNLMDAICGIYSSSIALSQLIKGREQLMVYLGKFNKRLKGKNRAYLAQTIRVIGSLVSFLQSKQSSSIKGGIARITDLLAGKAVDQINLYKLNAYIQESRIARKIDGYATHISNTEELGTTITTTRTTGHTAKSMPVLMHFQSFLLALMNPSAEGRFFYESEDDDMFLRYKLLDPANHFREIVEEARSVILAGGTMSPMDDYNEYLFPYLASDRLSTLSCQHIVPASSLAVYPVQRSSSGTVYDFKFSSREDHRTMVGAGEALINFVSVIPDGVVAFFPSYSYMEKCVKLWKATSLQMNHLGATRKKESIWETLQRKKSVYHESKITQSTETSAHIIPVSSKKESTGSASVLSSFTQSVRSGQGGLLLAVISGSLSEGINFSDELGRGIVVFGLPYPNLHSVEWKAKLEYIAHKAANSETSDRHKSSSKVTLNHLESTAAREYYENVTMRAVNQAVGRAIRHKNDYAAVMLVDTRYTTSRIQNKLPAWMKQSIRAETDVVSVKKSLEKFFESKPRPQ